MTLLKQNYYKHVMSPKMKMTCILEKTDKVVLELITYLPAVHT